MRFGMCIASFSFLSFLHYILLFSFLLSRSSCCLEQVALATPTGAGAVHMAIVATQALQVLVASAAVMRMRMIMRVRVAGEIVRAVRVAATIAHLDR